ncbi:MAG: enoyl-CoA hydratase/isomerase family protein [Candidatus Hydrogenedentes bacterium]|nr:enoyl-CoA hydratase/isomerase family protein [Candidatus Hydrogenedentota bacterium]
MSEIATYRREGRIGVIALNNPPVNALSLALRKGIIACLAEGAADAGAEALVLICEGRTFIAGADITEFDRPPMDPFLDIVIEHLEASPKAVVAAIHGTALGGGLETALGCHYRVAAPSAKCGLPEVSLGLVPGAGGTQRLPRLIGPADAAQIIASGVPVNAKKAHDLGLVDAIAEGDLLAGAIAFAERVVDEKMPLRKVRDLEEKVKNVPEGLFEGLRAEFAQKQRGFNSPQRAIDCVEAATQLPMDAGLKREREIFFEAVTGDQSKAQRHIFFSERAASKIPDVGKEIQAQPIKTAAVVGAGTMGGGIAMNFANAGIPVYLLDSTPELLEKGMGIVRKNYESGVKKGRMTEVQFEQVMGLIRPTLAYEDFANADIVVEAVFEEMEIKKQVFEKLDAICKPGCVLATNTSTLDVNEIAACTKRPESVIGLHFFSPANVMKLLEIVRGAKTSKELIATAFELSKAIKKVGVLVGVCDGFVGNRMVHPYVRESMFLVEEGAAPEQVDQALYDFGFAMGPCAMSDLAGLDVGWRIRKRQAATRPLDERYCDIADKICELGRYGQKTGAGWYRYEPGNRAPQPDPVVTELIAAVRRENSIEARSLSNEEIVERCVYALVNEGARILEEGIALRSSDIDVIYIYGYGFPVFRGGPMFYADTIGLDKVYARVCEFHKQHGGLWAPAPLLKELAEAGKRFTDYRRA